MTSSADLHHDMLTLVRRFDHPPESVFGAFTTAESCASWMCPAPGAQVRCDPFDFRPGGCSVTQMDFGSEGTWRSTDIYALVAPAQLILMHSRLEGPDGLESATVATLRFTPDAGGCVLRMTEQGAFASAESVAGQREGWDAMFDTLSAHLSESLARLNSRV
ncbi:Uncharacterized conserved protein YndB, AHSA1/START domain [Cribrihabitans marinus]|uniref:Uncharacterized conserved protein YndB, AHSA1/START domain n=1 Tax=Cribrihabitans marinus TaxID=1227549 RepID=A0A1H6TPS7_9RHOB|nr:SRPBCC domain-containing protein [Cribrihabitans marinus]GGH21921.1 activator of HSP90 ATPase [Cribrihabitans marinus]SEI78260.1 Uncharacterized conserved protein YndB, AHSA1/START domain [Cribrihabitans marinus]